MKLISNRKQHFYIEKENENNNLSYYYQVFEYIMTFLDSSLPENNIAQNYEDNIHYKKIEDKNFEKEKQGFVNMEESMNIKLDKSIFEEKKEDYIS